MAEPRTHTSAWGPHTVYKPRCAGGACTDCSRSRRTRAAVTSCVTDLLLGVERRQRPVPGAVRLLVPFPAVAAGTKRDTPHWRTHPWGANDVHFRRGFTLPELGAKQAVQVPAQARRHGRRQRAAATAPCGSPWALQALTCTQPAAVLRQPWSARSQSHTRFCLADGSRARPSTLSCKVQAHKRSTRGDQPTTQALALTGARSLPPD